MSVKSVIAELRRRNVPRAAVLYVGAVWALSQGIAQLTPVVGAPFWSARWFLIAAAIGFPFWLVFAWVFEFTARGLKREDELPPDPARAHSHARKLDLAIIAVLAIAVVLLLANTFVWRKGAGLQPQSAEIAAALAKVPAKSIAVLPLVNESGDSKQDYFADGLSEELISDLTRIHALKVIGAGSSFQFRNSKESPAQIGAKLGVAQLLEGRVRKQGDRMRIMVDLIRAKDGSEVWSQTYDRELKDIFAVQSDIAQAVAAALKIRLSGKPITSDSRPPSGNVVAYQALLKSGATVAKGTAQAYQQAIGLLEKAIAIDPRYTEAYCLLSNYSINLGAGYLHGDARQQAYARARTAVDKALAMAPNDPCTHLAQGYILANIDLDQMGALAEYKRAYALAPNSTRTMSFMANQLAIVGQLQRSVELWRKALVNDPLRVDWYVVLGNVLTAQGRLTEGEAVLRKALSLQPKYPGLHADIVVIDVLRGDAAAAAHEAGLESDPLDGIFARAQALQIGRDRKQADAALQSFIAKYGKTQPYGVAQLYAARDAPDAVFEWLEKARKQADPNLVSLLNDPLLLRFVHDPRFAALCKELGLPMPRMPSRKQASAKTRPDSLVRLADGFGVRILVKVGGQCCFDQLSSSSVKCCLPGWSILTGTGSLVGANHATKPSPPSVRTTLVASNLPAGTVIGCVPCAA